MYGKVYQLNLPCTCIVTFKSNLFISLMLRYVEAGNRAENLRMDVLQAIRYIIQA
jgi:hypothetical protein